MKYKSLIDRMTLEEKIAFCSGADTFNTKAIERLNIPSIGMADGPHGLRKQIAASDHLGMNNSVPATSFPTASLTACSWDRDLLREMGEAIGEEALQEGVSIVLGPGANIKRNPLCGRNFEYFSEDPYLAGEMAAGWISGIQSTGVGASLKHFAANNQETERMSSDSIIDERTLREIYLPAFERAVQAGQPATVMCAYNKLNGIYCSDHNRLLGEILRDEWGFNGVVVTDWGATNNRGASLQAGLDLEMPGSNGYFDQEVLAAVRTGTLSEERLDEAVERLLELVFSAAASRKANYQYDAEAHHQLARKIAAQSAVLLKNGDNLLPLRKDQKIALVGALAKEPRYQGAGSSHINPTRLSTVLEGFDALGFDTTYFPGYPLNGPADPGLLDAAAAGARGCEVAVVFAGLPEIFEAEGFDRADLCIPDSHNQLIEAVAAANPNTVVVLVGGAPVEMPWLSKVKAVLNLYLAGQAGGLAAADLLAGAVNPSGKLAETYPLGYADVPSAGFYETGGKQAQYREGIYVGYRYYDSAPKEVLFPFGHGLSYTSFQYQDLQISSSELSTPYDLQISLSVINTGSVDGAEVVQVYVSQDQPKIFRPQKELKEFTKIFLRAGETKAVHFSLKARSFAIYDPEACRWVVPAGTYQVRIGASSRDIRLSAEVGVHGQAVQANSRPLSAWYRAPQGHVTQADFESLLGRKIPPAKIPQKGEFDLNCSFYDMRGSFLIRQMTKLIVGSVVKSFGKADPYNPTHKLVLLSAVHNPLRSISLASPDSMPRHLIEGIVHLANGKFLQGIVSMMKKS